MKLLKSLILISFFLALAIAVWTISTTSVTSLDSSDWGLLTRLPLIYWIGIFLLGLSTALIIIGKSLSPQNTFAFFILIVVYIVLIPIIVESPIGLSANSLWPASESNQLIETAHISIETPRMLMSYESWPFFTIFTSILRILPGFTLETLAKWFPLFIIIFWASIVFLISRKFLKPEYALIGAGLFICASWTKQHYFGPQSFSFILFLIFIYLITKGSDFGFGLHKRSIFGLVFLTFVASLFSHALTSIVLLLIIIAAYVVTRIFAKHTFRIRKSNLFFCILCFVSLSAYVLFISPAFFASAFDSALSTLTDLGGLRVTQQLYRLPGSQFQQLTNISTYIIVGIFVLTSIIALLQMIRKKSMPRAQIAFWVGCLCTLALIAFFPYGEEGPFRAFIFGLPFFVLLSIYALKSNRILLCIFIVLLLTTSVPALYGSDSYRLATGPELQGSSYCAHYLPDGIHLLYKFSPYIRYFNPAIHLHFEVLGKPPFTSYNVSSIENSYNSTDFIIISRNQINYYYYYLGFNPFQFVDLNSNYTFATSKLYDNGNFTLYKSSEIG